jgi:hypothetical protein
MVARLCIANRRGTSFAICLLLLLLVGSPPSFAHDEWYRGLDLEPVLADSSLVLVGRVTGVSETKFGVGGKGERSLLQYKFEPGRSFEGFAIHREAPSRHARPDSAGHLVVCS